MKLPVSERLPNGWRRRRLIVVLRRFGLVGAGVFLMVLGLLSVPTPLPIGFVLFAIGLALLARGSRRARRSVEHLRRRLPPVSRGLNRVKHHMPHRFRSFIEWSDPGE